MFRNDWYKSSRTGYGPVLQLASMALSKVYDGRSNHSRPARRIVWKTIIVVGYGGCSSTRLERWTVNPVIAGSNPVSHPAVQYIDVTISNGHVTECSAVWVSASGSDPEGHWFKSSHSDEMFRNVAQFGSAHGRGPWGRRFKSSRSDRGIAQSGLEYSVWSRDVASSNLAAPT